MKLEDYKRVPKELNKGLGEWIVSIGTRVVKATWNVDFCLEYTTDGWKYFNFTSGMLGATPSKSVLEYKEWEELKLIEKGEKATFQDVVDSFYKDIDNQPAKDILLNQLQVYYELESNIHTYLEESNNPNKLRITFKSKGSHHTGTLIRNHKHIEFKYPYEKKEFIYLEPIIEVQDSLWRLPTILELQKLREDFPKEELEGQGFFLKKHYNVSEEGRCIDLSDGEIYASDRYNSKRYLALKRSFKGAIEWKFYVENFTQSSARRACEELNNASIYERKGLRTLTTDVEEPTIQIKQMTLLPLEKYTKEYPTHKELLKVINVWVKEYEESMALDIALIFLYFMTSLDFKERVLKFNTTLQNKQDFRDNMRSYIIPILSNAFGIPSVHFTKGTTEKEIPRCSTLKDLSYAMRVLLYTANPKEQQTLEIHWNTEKWLKEFDRDKNFPKELTPVNVVYNSLEAVMVEPYFTTYFPKGNRKKRVKLDYTSTNDLKEQMKSMLMEAIKSGNANCPIGHIEFTKKTNKDLL